MTIHRDNLYINKKYQGVVIPLSLEEMTAVAIRNQHLILAEELKKGVPLNYRDELGRNVLEYPDGHIEITEDIIPPYLRNQMKPCSHD